MEHEHGQQDGTSAGLARRSLVAAGLSGAAITLAPLLQRAASASTPPSTGAGTPESSAASTTTTAPLRPTADDISVLADAQSLELAAAELYGQALAKQPADHVTAAVLAAIRENHRAYAQAVSGLLGRAAPGVVAESLVKQRSAAFGGDAAAMLQAAYTLEADLAQTHVESIAELQSVSGARVLASIAVIEGRHSTVLADLAKQTDLNDLLAPEGEALSVMG